MLSTKRLLFATKSSPWTFFSKKCNFQRTSTGAALCRCWSFPFVFSLSTKSSVFLCCSGRNKKEVASSTTSIPAWLVVSIFFLITKSLADSVRISGILQKIRYVSVSLCCRETSPQLESNCWRLWKRNMNKSYSSNKKDLLVLAVVFNFFKSHDWGLTVLDSLPLAIKFIFFKVPQQADRKISEGKGILKPLLSEWAAVHSFTPQILLPFNILCVCTQACLES